MSSYISRAEILAGSVCAPPSFSFFLANRDLDETGEGGPDREVPPWLGMVCRLCSNPIQAFNARPSALRPRHLLDSVPSSAALAKVLTVGQF